MYSGEEFRLAGHLWRDLIVTVSKRHHYRDGTQTNGWDWGQELLAKGYEGMFLGRSNYFTFWCALRMFVLIDCLLIRMNFSLYWLYLN